MDSNLQESPDSKAEFRKPVNDAANRKYRKRSPVGGGSSSSSDGSPQHGRSSSPAQSRKDIAKVADGRRKKDDGRDLDREYGRTQSVRGSESYKHSDRQSSRSYHRHDDHGRRDRHVDDYGRGYSKSSSYRSGRDSRDSKNFDYSKPKPDILGRRDGDRDKDRHREDRGGRYGKTDKTDHKSSPAYDKSRGKDSSEHHLKESSRGDIKEHSDGTKAFSSKDQDSVAKKPKFTGPVIDEQACVKDSDIDAAKIAAMKAAELVNKNLVGTGYMSTDQKKKLLWGNKKTTTTEESTHRWDTANFGDRERQEKFHKLMGVKGDPNVENKADNPDAEKQREQLQMDLEKQYTAGLRRRDGRTVGLGL